MDKTLTAISTYLATQGYTNICVDYIPDTPDEIIGLFCWDHKAPEMGDGTGMRYIQVRVRRYDPTAALSVCKAITALLDSGQTERVLPITYTGKAIGRTRRLPIVMDRNGTTTTYYSEIALWGAN